MQGNIYRIREVDLGLTAGYRAISKGYDEEVTRLLFAL